MLYQVLTVIDGKASALMTFDSILLAASSPSLTQQRQSWTLPRELVAASIGLSLLSVILCLAVVAIDWPFLSKVTQGTDNAYDFTAEIKSLERVMIFRQDFYRGAWFLASGSVLALSAAYVVYMCSSPA